jgi:phosphatidyl-myo-inositol dimannoside synthase
MGDASEDIPELTTLKQSGFGRNRKNFITAAIKFARQSDIVLIGHINLLPIAFIIKILNPHINSILFVHGDEVWNDHLRPRKWFEPLLVKAIDKIASVSLYTANIMSREFSVPKAKFVSFPNAVDSLEFEPDLNLRETSTVLTVTRLGSGDRTKNVEELIQAIGKLKEQGHFVKLEIVGGGPRKAELEVLTHSLGLTEHIVFHGRLSDQALQSAYQRASLFCLPSSKEGFGIVYLEAWLYGLPVICGRLGASHEIINDGIDGLVADETDISDLSKKISSLLFDPARAKILGLNGLEKVHSLYTNPQAKLNLEKLISTSIV